MITKVRVKNFKCFGESGGDFELAPLTFLFGDNSAGKSTVLQALDFCLSGSKRSVSDGLAGLADGNSGGPQIDFAQHVYRHDTTRRMELEVRCTLEGGITKSAQATFCMDGGGPSDPGDWAVVRAAVQQFRHVAAPRPAAASFDNVSSLARLSRMKSVSPQKVNELLKQLEVDYEFIAEDQLRDTVFDLVLPIRHVGTGIDHLVNNLQQLVEMTSGTILALEEPESHLHPRQLGPFTKIITERVAAEKGSQVIVECHSDLMLFQLMNLVANGDVRCPEDVRIYYIRRQEGGSVLYPVTIFQNGDVEGWPGKLFPWRSELLSEVFQ